MARLHTSVSGLTSTRLHTSAWLLVATVALGGCDALGLETPGKVAERKEAEGRAIGSACRHAVRSIEDCYLTNPKASKAAIFTGWREMDAYMRENEIPGQPANPPPAPPLTGQAPGEEIIAPTGTVAQPNTPTRPAAQPTR